eukprot:12406814-Karenia_brevis.AAC.1
MSKEEEEYARMQQEMSEVQDRIDEINKILGDNAEDVAARVNDPDYVDPMLGHLPRAHQQHGHQDQLQRQHLHHFQKHPKSFQRVYRQVGESSRDDNECQH